VRKTLRDQQIQRDLAPKLFTLEENGVTLSRALAELAKQTGNTVEDLREMDTDPKFNLKLNKVTFWEALDVIAREADARVSLYERGGKIALRARPEGYVNPPASYSGLFRTTVRRISAARDLESDIGNYVAALEIAWEPRFRPFMLELNPQALAFEDDKNRKLSIDEEAMKNRLAVTNKVAVTFDVPLPSLQRASAKLGLLQGKVMMIGPTRMDTFAFDSTLAEMAKDPKAASLTRDGVTVKVDKLELVKDHWTLMMALEYPADGPDFESFESWLVYNEIHLKKKNGDETFPNNGGYVIESSAGNRALISYHFIDERGKKLVRGNPEDWTLAYRTPGLIVEVPVSFEFKDLPLP
jgi:hypothetical protein